MNTEDVIAQLRNASLDLQRVDDYYTRIIEEKNKTIKEYQDLIKDALQLVNDQQNLLEQGEL